MRKKFFSNYSKTVRIIFTLIMCILTLISIAQAPLNDEPCKAILILPTINCSFTTFSNESATTSSGIMVPSCANYIGGDVWFKVIVPFSGKLKFETNAISLKDAGMEIYSGKCNSLKLIECDDDDGTGNMPMIDRNGLIPRDTIFVRIWGKGSNEDFGQGSGRP